METLAGTTNSLSAIPGLSPGDRDALARQLKSAGVGSRPAEADKAWKAAKKVEAVFLGMLLKEMRKTVEQGSLFHGGMAEEMFQGELDDAYVKSFESAPGMGIARIYFGQIMRRNPAEAGKARAGLLGGFIPLEKANPPLSLASAGPRFLPLDKMIYREQFTPLKGTKRISDG